MKSSGSAHHQRATGYDFIPPDRAPASRRPTQAVRCKSDAVDAEFEVIRTPLHGYYRILNDNKRAGMARANRHWFLSVADRMSLLIERLLRRLPAKGFAGLVAGSFLAVFAFVFIATSTNVRAPAASGLAISEIEVSLIDSAGLRILEITGTAENVAGSDIVAPQLIASLSQGGGFVPAAYFKLPVPVVGEGLKVPFSVRVPYPGGKMPEVTVSADAALN